MRAFKHFKTICIHKFWVGYYCFRAGLYWQGIAHDLSKFSPTEFFESVKYYKGTSSPIDECKRIKGYSKAWLHHKGKNKHHYEYWQDNFDSGTTHLIMPCRYNLEMLCDYLGAGKAYNGKEFTYEGEYEWWTNIKDKKKAMHRVNYDFIEYMLRQIKERGIEELSCREANEKAYKYLVDTYKKENQQWRN